MLSAVLGCTFTLVVVLVLTVLLVRVKSTRDPKVVLILKNIYNIKAILQAISEARKQVAA